MPESTSPSWRKGPGRARSPTSWHPTGSPSSSSSRNRPRTPTWCSWESPGRRPGKFEDYYAHLRERTDGLPSTIFVLAAEEIAFREVLLRYDYRIGRSE